MLTPKVVEDNKFVLLVLSQKYAKYPNGVMSQEDFFQEGLLILDKAQNSFDSKKGSWNTYLDRSLRRSFATLLGKSKSSVSVGHRDIFNKEQNSCIYSKEAVTEDFIGCSDNLDLILDLSELFSPEEQLVYDYYVNGNSIKVIAYKTGFSVRKTRKLFKSLKIKILSYLND